MLCSTFICLAVKIFSISLVISSLIFGCSRMLFNFYVFVYFPTFFLLLLVSYHVSKQILEINLILNLFLWPNIWSILKNISCGFEWNVLCMSIIVQVEFFFYWMIIFLDDQTIAESVMLKSPILVVLLATSSQLC